VKNCLFGWFLAADAAVLLAACQTTPPLKNDALERAQATAQQAVQEKNDLEKQFLRDRLASVDSEVKATLARVQQMANANYEAQLLNRRNPQQNRHTFLVDQNTALVAANSPVPVKVDFIQEAEQRLPKVEQAATNEDAGAYYKGRWEAAVVAAGKEEQLRKEKEAVIADDEKRLRGKEQEVVRKFDEGMTTARDEMQQMAQKVSSATAKLYRQLIWIFGFAAIGAGALAGFFFYSGNPRMGLYVLGGAAIFGAGAFLTVWLQSHQWVVWLFLVVGVCAVAAAFIVKQGWKVRDTQLVAMAGKRDALARFLDTVGGQISEFGLKAATDLQNLDLHELEDVQERVVAYLKAHHLSVPEFLKE